MENNITVLTVTYPHELAIIRGRLESEGIECFVKDELTVQVNPFYSNAIGGIKLQVKESDFEKATEILKEAGYMKEEESYSFVEKSFSKLNIVTSKIPLIKKLRFEFRLTILVLLLSGILAVFIYNLVK